LFFIYLCGRSGEVDWMRGWLVVGSRCIAAAAVDVVAGLCGARQRTVTGCVIPGGWAVRRGVLLGDVVPGPRGVVAGQSGVVSSFLS
jgi:uncharacterized protein YqgC (DUF456 family)